jgi:hypothetical protein
VSAAAKLIATIDFAMMAFISVLQFEWLERPRQPTGSTGHHACMVSKTTEENCQRVDRRGLAKSAFIRSRCDAGR